MADTLKKLAEQWLDIDVNKTTRNEIISLLADENWPELDARLSKRIVFGTAGLRAKMEAGFSRINDVTILQASQGLAKYILKFNDTPSIVVGHDHRHNSKRYADLAAAAFLHYGYKVYYLGLTATPTVPFAVDQYDADGGVMVTSSHNPKDDNGYKVYWGNGCQIIPPHDSGIQQSILANLHPFGWDTDAVFAQHADTLVYCKEELVAKYIAAVTKDKSATDFKFVYTPMHGVGYEFARQIADKLSPTGLVAVPEQVDPDPDFPTVPFPNPEEKGALDLAMATADSLGIKLVLANDPDADRFSVAVKTDTWRQLTGNEIGFLFAQYVVSLQPDLSKVYLVNSTVSSQMIKSMAHVRGFHYTDTLTGFKWIGNKAIELENQGYTVPFAFEEAIGFMFDCEHDKDGLSALAMFLQMYQGWTRQGVNPLQVLADGYNQYGYFASLNGYYRTTDVTVFTQIFAQIRQSVPTTIGKYPVIAWRDLTTGYDSTTIDHKPLLPVDSSAQMITVELDADHGETIRFTARGSGTEPKLKVYIEAKSGSEPRSIQLAKDVWLTLRDNWFHPETNALTEVY